jgi:hypothetical protein
MGANPGWLDGYTPTSKEWNALWASKADDPNSGFATYLPTAGGTITGNLTVLGTINGSGGSFLPTAGGTLTGPLTVGDTGTGKLILTPGASSSIAPILSTNSSAGLQLSAGTAGVSIVGGGPLVSNNGINMSRSIVGSGALNPFSTWSTTLSGSTTTPNPIIWQWHTNDGINAGSNPIDFVNIDATLGAATIGHRTVLQVKLTQTAQSGNLASGLIPIGGFWQAVSFATQINATEGGTDNSQAGSYGQVFAGESIMRTLSTATNLHEVSCWEFDMNTAAPSYKKFGIKVDQLLTDVAEGVLSAAYAIENAGTSSNNGWHNGFLAIQPNANFPYAADGWMFNAPQATDYATFNTMAGGINIVDPTFTTGAIRSRNFLVDGLGTVRVGNGYLAKTSGGISLDTSGSVGPDEGTTLSGAAIFSGGTSGFVTGMTLYDPYGGTWITATTSSGVVLSVTCLRTPYFASATPPTNPITLTPGLTFYGNTTGALTVNITWTQPNELSLQPTGGVTRIGSGMIAANGSVATTTTSLGPAGSHTTIQEWLQVKNPAGTIRYIPMY